MLNLIFLIILEMSISASVSAVILIAIKTILHKAGFSRRILFFMWPVAAFRLLCPFTLPSRFSLFNVLESISKSTAYQSQTLNNMPVSAVQIDNISLQNITQSNSFQLTHYLAIFWLAGTAALIITVFLSCLRLKGRLRFAVKISENIYAADNIPTPFVFGIIKPKIYIPACFNGINLQHIIIHEQTHIRRADHLSKLLAYMILSVHWFNPIVWIMYKLFSDDIEFACDETVIKKLGNKNRKSYLNTLLSAATYESKKIPFYNVCFSFNNTKKRVNNMLSRKKSSKLYNAAAIMICLILSFALNTSATDIIDENTFSYPVSVPSSTHTPSPTKAADISDSARSDSLSYNESESAAVTEPDKQLSDSDISPVNPIDNDASYSENTSQIQSDISDYYAYAEHDSDDQYLLSSPAPYISEATAEPTDDNAIDTASATDIKIGTHIDDVHAAIGVEGYKDDSEIEKYELTDGNTAVFVYEDDRLKSGYILKNTD